MEDAGSATLHLTTMLPSPSASLESVPQVLQVTAALLAVQQVATPAARPLPHPPRPVQAPVAPVLNSLLVLVQATLTAHLAAAASTPENALAPLLLRSAMEAAASATVHPTTTLLWHSALQVRHLRAHQAVAPLAQHLA